MGTTARRAVNLLSAAVLFTALATAAAILVPKHYVATADVLLAPPRSAGSLAAGTVQSLATIAGGSTIDDAVETKLALPGTLGDRLSARQIGSTMVIRFTASATSADGAAAIAQTGADAFIHWLRHDGRASAALAARAVPPAQETYPPRWTWVVAGGLVGIALGIALMLRPRGDRRRVTSINDLAEAGGAPVLGVIGHTQDLAASPLVSSLPTGHPVTEAMRIIRTNLNFLPGAMNLRLIVVTSPRPAEGKSTTSCNLAISLAQTGASVVIVEGDLRKPSLAGYLGIKSKVGVTAVLVGRASLDAALQRTRVLGLDALTAGPRPSNPTEVLQTEAMADLLLDLRDRYDYVVVDAPPVLPVADAPLLAAIADGVVLVVRHDSTAVDQVQVSVERLHAVDAEVVGSVLTMSPRRATQRHGYGYGYGEGAPGRHAGGR